MVSEKEIIIPVTGSESKKRDDSNFINKKSGQFQISHEEKGEIKLLKDQLQRLQAEFINYKNRVTRERETDFSNAKGLLVTKILPVLDDFERMIDHHQVDRSCDVEGVTLIFQKLKKVLYEENLEEIQAVGQHFDPEFHEAVGVHETDVEQDGLVIEEWQKGYRLGKKLLRPSRVKVGKFTDKTASA